MASESSRKLILQLVAAYCGAADNASPAADTVPALVNACQQVARSSSKAEQLLGSQPSQQAQVLEWLSLASAELAGSVSDEKLSKINAALATRTFLAGGAAPSLADLLLFGLLHPAVSTLPAAQTNQSCNLLRWFDLIQHTAGAAAAGFAAVAVPLPAFVPLPPPPPPASSKPAASTATSATSAAPAQGGGKKEKAAAGGKAAAAAAADSSGSSKTTAAPAPAVAGAAAAAAAGAAPPEGAAAAAGGKQEKKEKKKEKKADAAPKPNKEAEEPRIDMLDIRVGQIVSVQQHPNADALYLEEIDVGEDKPRQVISGLVKFVPKEQMEGRRVVVCCNLKPAKMRDIMSYGMVLCASNDTHDKVDPITPPEGVPVGERITFEGYTADPLEEVNPKRKILERLFPDLTTAADGTPTYKGVPFMTTKGPVASTLPNAHVA
ncbi:hypothetical protein OEZ85_005404 [Tetradesmus obliquus]|uniref:tRNA-binding domain-containing protein n=1 Tax=Tetradesmus obliquus TaxID=3088 RepID=A0ABY8UHT4_TETOB|nr:hypothetical protein OEZ85_005404 [Tetradesmus obliquus]